MRDQLETQLVNFALSDKDIIKSRPFRKLHKISKGSLFLRYFDSYHRFVR